MGYREDLEELEEEGTELWDTHSMGELLEALENWGYGSGEELYHLITEEGGLSEEEAQIFRNLLSKINTSLNK